MLLKLLTQTNPETRLIVINTRNRNFLRKIFTNVESVYHHTPPPNSTPITTSNSPSKEEDSPKTDIPAKTAIKTTTVIGLETVKKNNER